jgi:hypothetical protein
MYKTERRGLQHISEVIYEIYPHLKPPKKEKVKKRRKEPP